MKKRLAIIVAVVMLLSLALPLGAMANVNQLRFKTNGDAIFEAGFSAYKVFDMEADANGGYNYTIAPAFAGFSFGGRSGKALADYIYTLNENSPELRLLTDALVRFVDSSTPNAVVDSAGVGTSALTIDVASPGYYFVVGQVKDDETGSIAHFMALRSTTQDDGGEISPLDINPKFDMPTITKQVDAEGTGEGSIGDEIIFNLSSAVPMNIGAFDEYTFIVHDKMHNLTYVDDSVVVSIGTVNNVRYFDFTVDYDAATKELTITFDSDEFLTQGPGELILIEYSATIDAAAITLDANGNPVVDANNDVVLEYSNDPLGDGTGKYDDDPPVDIYTFWFDFYKHAGVISGEHSAIAGVEFVLSKQGDLDLDELKAGNLAGTILLTEESPGVYKVAEAGTQGASQVITTPASGKVMVLGVGSGTYYLYETKAPAEFVLLAEPVPFTIVHLGEGAFTLNGVPSLTINIQNNRASMFPETGGIGRTIFFIAGGMIMVGSVVALVIRKKRADRSAG